MNNTNIIILTGPTRTGKTTFLKTFIDNRSDCGGFLTPNNDGKRVLFRIDDKSTHEFEIVTDRDIIKVHIGQYVFKQDAFTLGCDLILNASKTSYAFFIIDEIGKLELNNEGFNEALPDSFWSNIYKSKTKLILVIRDYLLYEAIRKYKIVSPVIIDIQDRQYKEYFMMACTN